MMRQKYGRNRAFNPPADRGSGPQPCQQEALDRPPLGKGHTIPHPPFRSARLDGTSHTNAATSPALPSRNPRAWRRLDGTPVREPADRGRGGALEAPFSIESLRGNARDRRERGCETPLLSWRPLQDGDRGRRGTVESHPDVCAEKLSTSGYGATGSEPMSCCSGVLRIAIGSDPGVTLN